MPFYYAVYHPEGIYEESPEDRLYRFRTRAQRTSFVAATYGDPARPRSINAQMKDWLYKYGQGRGKWFVDEYGEYTVPRKGYFDGCDD